MQNTSRWRFNQFQPTHIWNLWSHKTDANLKDSACTVRVLLSVKAEFIEEQKFYKKRKTFDISLILVRKKDMS